MQNPSVVVLIRFKSSLPLNEAMHIAEQRAPQFRALTGLVQKYYLFDEAKGEFGGLYMWDSAESFKAFRESELRATIAEAYKLEGEARIEVYQNMLTLRE